MNFSKSFAVFKDKWILLYSLFPIAIGGGLYYMLGMWLYKDAMVSLRTWINETLSTGDSVFLAWVIGIFLTLVLFFLISFTAVMLISLLSSPFNDLISSRTEQIITGKKVEVAGGVLGVILREIKKFLFIILLSAVGLVCSLFPGGQFITLFVAVVLLCFQFLDYSWSRHGLSIMPILVNFSEHFFRYGISGFLLYFLVGIPFINILVLPFCVVHFTVLYCEGLGVEEP